MKLIHQVGEVAIAWVIIAALVYSGTAMLLLSGKLIKVVINLFM